MECLGPLCRTGRSGAVGLIYCLATRKLQCSECQEMEARQRLLEGMSQVACLKGFMMPLRVLRRPQAVQVEFPLLAAHLIQLAPGLSCHDVALPALLPSLVWSEVVQSRPKGVPLPLSGDPDPLVWSMYLREHKRFCGNVQALWRAIPSAHRSSTTVTRRSALYCCAMMRCSTHKRG